MRERKTRDDYDIEQFTSEGWEAVSCCPTRKEALAEIKTYRENLPGEYRIKHRRIPIDTHKKGDKVRCLSDGQVGAIGFVDKNNGVYTVNYCNERGEATYRDVKCNRVESV